MRVCVCVCVCVYIYIYVSKHSFSFHQGFLCCWRVPRGYTVDISTDHARALQQVHTHRDMSRPLHHLPTTTTRDPRNLLPNASGHKTQELFISESCVLWFHNIHLTKTSSTFSVTSEIPEQSKTGHNRWRPRERTQRHFSKLSTPDF